PEQGETSGNWTSGDDQDFQQAADMMSDAQDMMEDAREETKMTRRAVEDLQDRLEIDTKYGEEPASRGPRYERTGVSMSDSAASSGPSLPGSREGGVEAKPDLVSSILSQNIAPKDKCPCGNGKLYKDCHMKKGKKKKKKW
ncbi:MAG: SEC-C domain-containing protein, partial [Candidatus Poseidoniales archaeon]